MTSTLSLPSIVVTSPDGTTDHHSSMTFPAAGPAGVPDAPTVSSHEIENRPYDTGIITPSNMATPDGISSTTMGARPYNGPLGQGTFTAYLVMIPHPDFSCCSWIEAFFDLTINGERNDVGHAVAYIVDISADSKFVQEILQSEKRDVEVVRMMRTLYDSLAEPRERFTRYADALMADRICHVDKLEIGKEYRSGKGIGKMALDCFHELLPRLNNGHGFSGTVVLSPALTEGAYTEYAEEGNKAEECEEKLLRFYESCGYELWVRGRRYVDGSISVMAREIAVSSIDV